MASYRPPGPYQLSGTLPTNPQGDPVKRSPKTGFSGGGNSWAGHQQYSYYDGVEDLAAGVTRTQQSYDNSRGNYVAECLASGPYIEEQETILDQFEDQELISSGQSPLRGVSTRSKPYPPAPCEVTPVLAHYADQGVLRDVAARYPPFSGRQSRKFVKPVRDFLERFPTSEYETSYPYDLHLNHPHAPSTRSRVQTLTRARALSLAQPAPGTELSRDITQIRRQRTLEQVDKFEFGNNNVGGYQAARRDYVPPKLPPDSKAQPRIRQLSERDIFHHNLSAKMASWFSRTRYTSDSPGDHHQESIRSTSSEGSKASKHGHSMAKRSSDGDESGIEKIGAIREKLAGDGASPQGPAKASEMPSSRVAPPSGQKSALRIPGDGGDVEHSGSSEKSSTGRILTGSAPFADSRDLRDFHDTFDTPVPVTNGRSPSYTAYNGSRGAGVYKVHAESFPDFDGYVDHHGHLGSGLGHKNRDEEGRSNLSPYPASPSIYSTYPSKANSYASGGDYLNAALPELPNDSVPAPNHPEFEATSLASIHYDPSHMNKMFQELHAHIDQATNFGIRRLETKIDGVGDRMMKEVNDLKEKFFAMKETTKLCVDGYEKAATGMASMAAEIRVCADNAGTARVSTTSMIGAVDRLANELSRFTLDLESMNDDIRACHDSVTTLNAGLESYIAARTANIEDRIEEVLAMMGGQN